MKAQIEKLREIRKAVSSKEYIEYMKDLEASGYIDISDTKTVEMVVQHVYGVQDKETVDLLVNTWKEYKENAPKSYWNK